MKKIYYLTLIFMAALLAISGQMSYASLPTDHSGEAQPVSPTSTKNYVLSYTYLEALSSHPATLYTGQASPEITYFDGLGRPIQTILVKNTWAGTDLVNYQTYDNYGREDKSYLPYSYVQENGSFVSFATFVAQQQNEYSVNGNDRYYAFSQKEYENSPLNRVLKQGFPGEDWQTNAHPVQYAYKTNTGQVSSFKFSGSSFSTVNYDAGSLYINETTDEDGNTVKEYLDKEGKVVQSKIGNDSTMYCYDEFGLLRCVIQPLVDTPDSTSSCFFYNYDERKRLTEKQVPGKGVEYMIYDSRDRLVLTQDANQRDKSPDEWTYTLYDGLNRPVEIGVWPSSTPRNTLVNSIDASLTYMEGQAGKVVLKEIQYDNYSGLDAIYKLNSDSTLLGVDQATDNTGRVTCEITRLLNDPDSALMKVYRYDKYGRVIQTISDSHLGGIDYITTCYNFSGQDTLTRYRHRDTIYYDMKTNRDHRGRPVKISMQINGGTVTNIASYRYRDDGKLQYKYLHSQNGDPYMQNSNYAYNIRGWLESVDDPVNFDGNDKFGFDLYYNNPPSGVDACYNGNISGFKWGVAVVNPNKLYKYSYDDHNRLVGADFYKSGYSTSAFDVSYSYDANGNLLTLERNGISGSAIDDLEYTYSSGNRLSYVNDLASTSYETNYPGDNSSNYFGYDSNGNMEYEPNKGMDITYNLLNLPEEVSESLNKQIDYFYTFDGEKLRKTVENSGTITKVDYCGPFEYQTAYGLRSLKRIHTPEGVALYEGGEWVYDYYLKDHLCNTRVVVRTYDGGTTSTVSQYVDYYPFGMEISNLSANFNSSDYRYLYNGKEHQNDLDLDWYDYGARFYDPALGRWGVIDPMADEPHNFAYSPYNYCINNPIVFIDPDGMDWFYNEKTGDVIYVTNLYKGAEGGMDKGWKWMGNNNMFAYDDETEDGLNQEKLDISLLKEYNGKISYDNHSFFGELTLKGDDAKSFMKEQGYKFNPIQQVISEQKLTYAVPYAPRQPDLKTIITEKSKYMKTNYAVSSIGSTTPVIKLQKDPLSFYLTGRYEIIYSKNTAENIFNRIINMAFGVPSPKVYNSWSEYNYRNIAINDFINYHGEK